MGAQGSTADHEAARIAGGQHGVITWLQLLAAGLTRRMIARRVQKGTLHRVYRGVYRVGHTAPSTEARYLAAVLAAGEGALLTGKAAAHLMRLLRGGEPRPEVLARTERRIKGVTTKRTRRLDNRDRQVHHGIPCTTIARTLVSLAESLPEEELARACHQATVLYRTQPEDVEAVLARHPNTPGATTLRSILRGDTKTTLSNLERRYHATSHAWEQDRQREREARRRGDGFRRFTSGDVFDRPDEILEELRPLLCL
jgi:hypothetical protein